MLNKIIAVATALISLAVFHSAWILFGFNDETQTLMQVLFGESGMAWMLFALGMVILRLAFLAWRSRALVAVMPLASLVAVYALDIGWACLPRHPR